MVHSFTSVELQTVLGLIKLSVLGLGVMMTYFAVRAYQRTTGHYGVLLADSG